MNYKNKIPENIKCIMSKLHENGFSCYIAGGAVRDMLLGYEPNDYDLFTSATGQEILSLFPLGKVIGNDERQKKILTVIVDGVEVSSYRKNGNRLEICTNLDQHLATCDFTINAMAMDVYGEIYDPHKGISELTNGSGIKFVGKPVERIIEDPIRILRGIRFCLKYNLRFSISSLKACIENIDLATMMPKERIRMEIMKILKNGIQAHNFRRRSIKMLLIQFLPKEFNCLININGGKHHNETVYEHSFYCYQEMFKLTDNPLLLLAALLHDVGKSQYTLDSNGDITFPSHEIYSYKIVKKWMKEYRFSNDEIDYVANLILFHMYDAKMKDKGLCKLYANLDKHNIPVEHLRYLRHADAQANMKNKRWKIAEKSNRIVQKYYQFKYERKPFTREDLEVDGHDCIIHGIFEENIGLMLNKLVELTQDGCIPNSRPQLLKFIMENA